MPKINSVGWHTYHHHQPSDTPPPSPRRIPRPHHITSCGRGRRTSRSSAVPGSTKAFLPTFLAARPGELHGSWKCRPAWCCRPLALLPASGSQVVWSVRLPWHLVRLTPAVRARPRRPSRARPGPRAPPTVAAPHRGRTTRPRGAPGRGMTRPRGAPGRGRPTRVRECVCVGGWSTTGGRATGAALAPGRARAPLGSRVGCGGGR